MKSILRSTAAVILSLVVALALVVAIEVISAVMHPFPEDFGGTREEVAAHVANYPAGVLALLGGAGYALTMGVSVWLATRLGSSRHPAHGYGVGALLLAALIFNMSMLPYPLWFVVLDLILLPACIYLGVKLGRGEVGNGAKPVAQNE